MLTLLAMIGLFLLVLGLVIVLLMGMFFSSDMGGIFVNVFNYATSTGIADLVTVGVMLIILFAAFRGTSRYLVLRHREDVGFCAPADRPNDHRTDCFHPDSYVLLHGLGLGVSLGWCPMCSYLRIAGRVRPGFERVHQT